MVSHGEEDEEEEEEEEEDICAAAKRPRLNGFAGAAVAAAAVGRPDSPRHVSPEEWLKFWENGFIDLGRVVPDELLLRMEVRIDAIMMGEVQYGERLMMQLDPGSAYGDLVQFAQQTASFKGPRRDYRKIGEAGFGLECDDVFREAMLQPLFLDVFDRVYGAHLDVAIYRAMVFNKPAGKGTDLPWHQDGGGWWGLDRDPQIFVWTALDDATRENGCIQVVPGSHRLGLLSRRGHTVSQANLEAHHVEERRVDMEVQRGHSVLIHNFLLHRSGTNPTAKPRRAFSVNYADGRTRVLDPKPIVQPEGRTGPKLGFPEKGASLPIIMKRELPAF